MMFKIFDGRSTFYQWDIDRKLIVNDASINEVHFCNRTGECSLVSEVYEEDGLRLANVPNVLLQMDWPIKVYGYDTNHTRYCENYIVVKRSKPEDYVYTEEEVHFWQELEERINQIENKGVSDEKIASAVGSYLEENPVEVDLTGYATEEYVIQAIGEIPEPDMSDYATIKDVEDAVKNIDIPDVDLTGYATEKYVDTAIANAQLGGGDVDLSNYYTKDEVDSAIEEIELTPGPAGKDGYTPVKGIDYFDGAPGVDGKDGEDYVLTEDDKADIAALVEVSAPDVDLTDYYTKEEINNLLANMPAGDIPSGEEVLF